MTRVQNELFTLIKEGTKHDHLANELVFLVQ